MAVKTKAAAKEPTQCESEFESLRLIELGIENFKRIKLARIRPHVGLTTISGRNAQGKSSIIDGFFALFAGGRAVQREPIHRGATEGKIWVDLGKDNEPKVRVTRRFKLRESGEQTTDLIIEGADGHRFTSPQAIADGLYAPIAMDPFEFKRLKPAEQVEILKGLVPGFDFAMNEAKRKALYADRTDTGRLRDRAEAAAKAVVLPKGEKPTPIDVAAQTDKLSAALAANAEIDAIARTRAANEKRLAELEESLVEIQERADDLRELIGSYQPLPEKHDIDAIQAELRSASAINEAAAAFEKRETLEREAREAADAYASMTAEIEAVDKAKAQAIADAKLPVNGLAFDDTGVTLDGLPFEQASSAEQLKTSTLVAMALNPELRVIVVREGALLDDDSLEMLGAMAESRGYDVLVERVTNGERGVGYVIEDGEVVS